MKGEGLKRKYNFSKVGFVFAMRKREAFEKKFEVGGILLIDGASGFSK